MPLQGRGHRVVAPDSKDNVAHDRLLALPHFRHDVFDPDAVGVRLELILDALELNLILNRGPEERRQVEEHPGVEGVGFGHARLLPHGRVGFVILVDRSQDLP